MPHGVDTALILAGGRGTRLEGELRGVPKVLAPVAGRPFLAWLLDQLVEFGFRDAVLCTGHMAEMVESNFGKCFGPLELHYSREAFPLGTGGALRLAAERTDSDLVLALNGDSYCRYQVQDLTTAYMAH